jgi:hypothetical protein
MFYHPDLVTNEGVWLDSPDGGRIGPIDIAIAPLVDALNHVPGVQTLQSCSGHGYEAYILFRATNGDQDALMRSPVIQRIALVLQGRPNAARLVREQYLTWDGGWPEGKDRFDLRFVIGSYWPREDQAEAHYAAYCAFRDELVAACCITASAEAW